MNKLVHQQFHDSEIFKTGVNTNKVLGPKFLNDMLGVLKESILPQ